jgi:dTDP-4-dehydrorhamnose reductase
MQLLNILLLGANGQVGRQLQRSLAPLGVVTALGRQGSGGLCGDLADLAGLAETVRTVAPDVIVNAAAYTAVDRAESEPEQARQINAHAPAALARAAKEINAWLIHYSTDYVFDGTGTAAWQEDDPKDPVNVYGQTKLQGEQAVCQNGCCYLIFRTSWVYAALGKNFINTMLSLAAQRESLKVVNDQTGAPTGADLIADVTAHVLRSAYPDKTLSGIYHLAAAGQATWWEYANLVISAAAESGMALKTKSENIIPVPSAEFPTPAPRPGNSRLDTTRLRTTFSLRMPPWEDGVLRVVGEKC